MLPYASYRPLISLTLPALTRNAMMPSHSSSRADQAPPPPTIVLGLGVTVIATLAVTGDVDDEPLQLIE
jgi:hypothetical protein